MKKDLLDRREFMQTASMAALGAAAMMTPGTAMASGVLKPGSKPWRGLFPVAQTPFTPDNKLDLDCLAAQVKFCNVNRVPGLMWPLNSSGWFHLTEKERMDGTESIMAAAKGGKTAVVIGVQALGGDINAAVRYAQHAAKCGADGLISLPPGALADKGAAKVSDRAVLDYYKTLGAATDLPLMIQSYGDMSVEFIVELSGQIPTLIGVKDETTGSPFAPHPGIQETSRQKVRGHGCTQLHSNAG